MSILQNVWSTHLEGEFIKPYYRNLREFLIAEYRARVIYPDKYDIFNALHLTTFTGTKVAIIGQDPGPWTEFFGQTWGEPAPVPAKHF